MVGKISLDGNLSFQRIVKLAAWSLKLAAKVPVTKHNFSKQKQR
jgi:hypothetical protein